MHDSDVAADKSREISWGLVSVQRRRIVALLGYLGRDGDLEGNKYMYIFWEGYRDSLKDTMWVKSKYWALVDTCILMHCILSIKGILFHISFNLTNSSIPAALTHMGVTISMRVVAVLNQ